MKKKLTALLAVFLVTVSILPVDASALGQARTKIIATCAVPDVTIEVTVPASTNAYINPKRVSVSLGSTFTEGQILTDPAYIENFSEVPVSVNVAVTGSIKSSSTLKLSETSTQGETSKLAFVYLQMKKTDDPEDFYYWNSGYNADQDIVLSTTTREKSGMVTLDPGSEGEGERFGLFRLSGDCVAEPTNDPWKTRDSFTAKIVFTFKALPLT